MGRPRCLGRTDSENRNKKSWFRDPLNLRAQAGRFPPCPLYPLRLSRRFILWRKWTRETPHSRDTRDGQQDEAPHQIRQIQCSSIVWRIRTGLLPPFYSPKTCSPDLLSILALLPRAERLSFGSVNQSNRNNLKVLLATSCEELTHWKRLWCWEGLGAAGEGDDRGWDGWMASPTRWTWVWVNSRRWWWTGRPGVLRFMGLQRVGHDWATGLTKEHQQRGKQLSPVHKPQ